MRLPCPFVALQDTQRTAMDFSFQNQTPLATPSLKARFDDPEGGFLPFWNIPIRVDPSDLSYSEAQEQTNKPKSLFACVREYMDKTWFNDVMCLFRPEVTLDTYQRNLFQAAQLPEIDNMVRDDFEEIYQPIENTPDYAYDLLLDYIAEKNPESPYAFEYRDIELPTWNSHWTHRFDDLMENFYTSYEFKHEVWGRGAREFTLEHLAYAFFHHALPNLYGAWQVDIPFLFYESEKVLMRHSYLPWLSMYHCEYHCMKHLDHLSCQGACKYDLMEFKHFLAFFYAKFLRVDTATFGRMVSLYEEEYRVFDNFYSRQEVENFFIYYLLGHKFEQAFPTLGPMSQRRACDRLVRQVNKMTKISEQKKARKAERQLKHIERRALYKIERAKARDEKCYPTLGVTGISKRIATAASHFQKGFRELFYGGDNTVVERWLLMFMPILTNPTPSGFFTAFLWLLNNLGISIFNAAKDLMHYCTEFVTKFAKTALSKIDAWSDLPQHQLESAGIETAAPTMGEEISTSSSTSKLEQLVISHGLRTPALLATILAGAAATVAAYLVGSQPTNSRFKLDGWDRLITGCSNLSKFKAGAYAYISIMRDFCSWVYTLIEDNVMSGQDAELVRLVKNVELEDVPAEGWVKEKFFEMYAFITDTRNLSLVMTTSEWRKKASYVERVLVSINATLAQSPSIERETAIARDTAAKMLAAVQKITGPAFKNYTENFSRMRPYVFMFQGKPGRGKSVFTPLFASGMLDLLYEQNEFEVPADKSQRMLAVNFGDKYLTSYKNQYCLVVDDIFQDRDGALEGTSSALQFIGWVSNCPYGTVQADLSSKGILFESKMLVCSSNIEEPSSNSIHSQDALTRRIDYQIRMESDAAAAPEPLMGGRQVRFDIYQPVETNSATGTWKLVKQRSIYGALNLIEDATKHFVAHYRKEKEILKSRTLTKDDLAELRSRIFGPEKSQPTGGYISKPFEAAYDAARKYVWYTASDEFRDLKDSYSCFVYAMERRWLSLDAGEITKGPYFDMVPEDIKKDLLQYMKLHGDCENDKDFVVQLSFIPRVRPQLWARYHTQLSEKLEKLADTRIGRCISALIEKCGGSKAFMLGSLGLVGIAAAGISLYRFFQSSDEDCYNAEPSGVRYDSGKPRRAPKRFTSARAFPSSGMYDARDDPSADSIIDSLSSRAHIVKISYSIGDKTYAQVALRLKNTCILTNNHFFTFMIQAFNEIHKKPHFTVHVPINGAIKKVEEIYDQGKKCVLPNQDVAVYKCSAAMPAARDIVHHFLPADYEFPETTNCKIVRTSPNAFGTTVETCSNGMYATYGQVMGAYNFPDEQGKDRSFVMSKSWLVNFTGQRGHSGSVLVACNRQMSYKLLGIQSSVGERSGTFFEPLNQDDLNIALERVGCGEPICVDCCGVFASLGVDTEFDPPSHIHNESLIYMGQLVDSNKALALPGTTKLVKSLVYNDETSTMGPSVMRKNDPRLKNPDCDDILRYNMKGYDSHIGAVDQQVLSETTEELAQYLKIAYRVNNIPNQLLDEVEMINGCQGVYKAIDMHTSPGFPFVKERKRPDLKGKFEWFDEYLAADGRKMYSMKQQLRDRIEFREREALEGRRLEDSFGYTCLKDEKRSLQKIKDGKTRVFICLPMDYNLLIRKYFGAFIASQHQKAAQPGIVSCVGIDPLTSWKGIYTELSKINSKWEDFDYANWDQSLHPAFFEAYARIVSEYYGDSEQSDNHRVRSVLMHELCYTFLIMNNSLVYKTCGQCSGCAITAEINCIIHELLMLYSYKLYWRRRGEFKDICDFHSNCAIRVYGDDILFSTSEVNGFCGAEHRIIAEELGMRITTAQKDLNFRVKEPSECTFLKRSFVKDDRFPQEILCPIKKEVIEEIPNWIHRCDDQLEATIVNINCALLEAFLCGKDYFDNLRSLLSGRLAQLCPGALTRINTYNYYLNEYISGKMKVLGCHEDYFIERGNLDD